jgi:hypothetical protein
MRRRLSGLVAVVGVLLLSGFEPILSYKQAIEAAQTACGKLVGKNIRTDLQWFGAGPGPFPTTRGAHWQLTAIAQGDDGPGPKHWYFKVDIPPSGAGPNTCLVNGAIPGSKLVIPAPPPPDPRPLAQKRNT